MSDVCSDSLIFVFILFKRQVKEFCTFDNCLMNIIYE